MKAPVYLMTYERPEYFAKSVPQLLKTDLSQMKEFAVFDDCSKLPEKLTQLSEFEKQGYKIVRAKRWGGTKYVFIDMLKRAFVEQTDNEVFVLVQDDIKYNSQWLNKLIEVYPKVPNLGILTCWDRRRYTKKPLEKDWVLRNPQNGKNCRMGGPCWLVTKALGLSILEKNEKFIRSCGYDSAFQKRSFNLGFNNATTIPSYIEHFGRISIAHIGRCRGTAHNAWNFIGSSYIDEHGQEKFYDN